MSDQNGNNVLIFLLLFVSLLIPKVQILAVWIDCYQFIFNYPN